MVPKTELVDIMICAAEKAAETLKHDFSEVEHLQVSRKGPADFVSTADLQSQKVLREELAKVLPNFGFVFEEEDSAADTSGLPERWIIDPLDGTSNFLHNLPHWAISIAAEQAGEVVAGVVCDPMKEEIFWAAKGVGAYCNSKRLSVSARSDLSDCLFATGAPFAGVMQKKPNYLNQLNAVIEKSAGIRRWGTASLDLAYVAAGRFDGFWEAGLGYYDVAAGALLVLEAGGLVVPIDTSKHPLREGNIIASNAEIHDKLVTLIRKA